MRYKNMYVYIEIYLYICVISSITYGDHARGKLLADHFNGIKKSNWMGAAGTNCATYTTPAGGHEFNDYEEIYYPMASGAYDGDLKLDGIETYGDTAANGGITSIKVTYYNKNGGSDEYYSFHHSVYDMYTKAYTSIRASGGSTYNWSAKGMKYAASTGSQITYLFFNANRNGGANPTLTAGTSVGGTGAKHEDGGVLQGSNWLSIAAFHGKFAADGKLMCLRIYYMNDPDNPTG